MPYWIEKGDQLISNQWDPMLTLVEDTYDKHDIVFDPCDTFLNGDIIGQGKEFPGCREASAESIDELIRKTYISSIKNGKINKEAISG